MKSIYQLLFEQEESNKEIKFEDPPEESVSIKNANTPLARKSKDSVDEQIDSLILLYESKAIRDEDEESYLNESMFKKSLIALLREQEEPPGAAAGDAENEVPDDSPESSPGEDSSMTAPDEPSGSEEMETDGPAEKDLVPDLDVDEFTRRVARLVMNHRHLLRIEDVIVNRAKNFLDENYGDAFVSKYLDSLEAKYGIEVSESPEDEDVNDAPYSIGANPAGAGISGGS